MHKKEDFGYVEQDYEFEEVYDEKDDNLGENNADKPMVPGKTVFQIPLKSFLKLFPLMKLLRCMKMLSLV